MRISGNTQNDKKKETLRDATLVVKCTTIERLMTTLTRVNIKLLTTFVFVAAGILIETRFQMQKHRPQFCWVGSWHHMERRIIMIGMGIPRDSSIP